MPGSTHAIVGPTLKRLSEHEIAPRSGPHRQACDFTKLHRIRDWLEPYEDSITGDSVVYVGFCTVVSSFPATPQERRPLTSHVRDHSGHERFVLREDTFKPPQEAGRWDQDCFVVLDLGAHSALQTTLLPTQLSLRTHGGIWVLSRMQGFLVQRFAYENQHASTKRPTSYVALPDRLSQFLLGFWSGASRLRPRRLRAALPGYDMDRFGEADSFGMNRRHP